MAYSSAKEVSGCDAGTDVVAGVVADVRSV